MKKGFTIIELLVVLAIFSIAVLVVSWILINSFRSNAIIWEQLATQNDGRKVLQQAVDDIRRAEQASTGAYLLAIAEDNNLIFYSNIDEDSARERVHYWLEDKILKKGVLKPSGVPLAYSGAEAVVELAHNIDNVTQGVPVFSYFDENYTGTEAALAQPVNITDIRVVRVQLELEKDPTESPLPLHAESTVQIRSLKDE